MILDRLLKKILQVVFFIVSLSSMIAFMVLTLVTTYWGLKEYLEWLLF